MEKKILKLYVYKAVSSLGSYFYEIRGVDGTKFLNFPNAKKNALRFSKSERQKAEAELVDLITSMCQPATEWLKEKSATLHELPFKVELVFNQEFKIQMPARIRKSRTNSSVTDESKPYEVVLNMGHQYLYLPTELSDAILFLGVMRKLN